MDVIHLAERFINIPGNTGYEAAIAENVESVCIDLGFTCAREPVADGRWNLYVNWNDSPRVVLCTHLDTVPPHFPARIDGPYLYGRGACDTRGIMAAMICAGERLAAMGHRPAFLFVVGEETDSIGAKTAAASNHTSSYIVVGEPTMNKLAQGHKGTLSYQISTHGSAGHSAYPQSGSSAVHSLLDLLDTIRNTDWGEDSVLGPATTNIGLITGGIAPNVIAPSATATIVHRIVDSVESRRQRVIDLCGDRADLDFISQTEPQFMFCPEGFETTTVNFGTDIPYLRSMAIPVLIGPGSILDAHTANEKISLEELQEAIDIYQRLYVTLDGYSS